MLLGGVLEFDAKKKDKEWAKTVNMLILINSEFLVSQETYSFLKSYSVGDYDTEQFKLNFYDRETILKNDPSQIRIDFQPIDLLSVYRHVITSAIDKQPLNTECKCTDETAISKMEEDIAKKRVYKQQIEPFLKLSTKALGGNPNMVKEQDTAGYNSNMDQADALGLDMSNPLDEQIWKSSLQRAKWESSLEVAIDHFFNLSDEKELRKKWVHDYFDCNVIASQTATNSASGLPETMYLKPYSVYTVNATRPDRSDAIGMGYNRIMSVKTFLELFIKEVNDEDELNEILVAANIQTGMIYTGIWYGHGEQPEGTCTWGEFLGMSLKVGYIEWKTQNIDNYESVDEYGTTNVYKRPSDFEPKKGKKSKLEKRFYESIYKWYFLRDNAVSVYGFGLLPNQIRKGTFSELSDFSIQIYFEEGQSMTERAIPHIQRFFDLWTKYQYLWLKAKASGTAYDLDSVYKIMQDIKAPDGGALDPISYVRFLESTTDFLYKSAKDESGNPLGGDGTPFKKVERGVDVATVQELIAGMTLQINYIRTVTGINEVRTGGTPQDNGQGYKVSVFNLQRSQDATYYIESGLYKLIGNQANWIAYATQEIITEKDYTYDSLVEAIGQYNVDCIESLDNKNPKSFSIFTGISMTDLEKVEVSQDAQLLAQQGVISLANKYMVEEAGSYKQARQLLAYFQEKSLQQASQSKQQETAMAMQLEDKKHQDKMQELALTTQSAYKTATDVAYIQKGEKQMTEAIKSDTKQKMQTEKLKATQVKSLQDHLQKKDLSAFESSIESQTPQNATT